MKSPTNNKHYLKRTVKQILNNYYIQVVRKRTQKENIIFISPTPEEKINNDYINKNSFQITHPQFQSKKYIFNKCVYIYR